MFKANIKGTTIFNYGQIARSCFQQCGFLAVTQGGAVSVNGKGQITKILANPSAINIQSDVITGYIGCPTGNIGVRDRFKRSGTDSDFQLAVTPARPLGQGVVEFRIIGNRKLVAAVIGASQIISRIKSTGGFFIREPLANGLILGLHGCGHIGCGNSIQV